MQEKPLRAHSADVYRNIKGDVMRGAFLPGERLDPSELARKTGSSPATVHMLLGRLASEHLLLYLPGEGFHMPFLTEGALRDSFRWLHTLGLNALDLAVPEPLAEPDSASSPLEHVDLPGEILSAERFFRTLAERTEIAEIMIAMTQANDRLRTIRYLELRLFDDVQSEIDRLTDLMEAENDIGLRASLAAYRDRRIARASELVRLRHHVRL